MSATEGADVRRTAWLVLSPWLVVAAVGAVAAGVALLLAELWTTDGGGMGNLGGILVAVALAALLWCAGSVAALLVLARRTFPRERAWTVVGWAVLAAVVGSVVLGAVAGPLDAIGVPFAFGLVPVALPAAGTVAFLAMERRLTGRALPPRT